MKIRFLLPTLILITNLTIAQWFWQHPTPQGNHLRSVSMTDANVATAVGVWGAIIRTTDGGNTWTNQINPEAGSTKEDVFFINDNVGFAVGSYGKIIHTTNGGVSFVEEKEIYGIPTTYSLTQNFPNPFNPSTKIKYSVPQSSKVLVKVFDILSNEIETLVNEEKPDGTYELNWNADNLPSGIYCYRIKAGDFVETKKMILLK